MKVKENTENPTVPKLYYVELSGTCRRCGSKATYRSPIGDRYIGVETCCSWGGCNGTATYSKIEAHEALYVPRDPANRRDGEFFTAEEVKGQFGITVP